MTNPTDSNTMDEVASEPSPIRRMIKIGLCAVLYLGGLFTMIGAQQGAFEHLEGWQEASLGLGSALVILVITLLWVKTFNISAKSDEPIAPSTKKSQRVLIMSMAFGGIMALLFYVSTISSGFDMSETHMFSNSPLPPILGIGSAALYVVGMIYACYHWQKSADEHERAAITAGLMGSFYFYSIAGPAWWMLQRSGAVPAQDPMVMYIIVLTVFSAIWTYKRGE